MTYALQVKFKSNAAPWSGRYEPLLCHQPADDEAATKWAVGMSDGVAIPLPATVADCIFGKCGCADASVCKFARCNNCDNVVGADKKTLVDHSCEEWETCPDCGGPLNERRVYGAL